MTQNQQFLTGLPENEALLRSMIEGLAEGVIIADLEKVALYCNDRICEMTGYTREEIILKRCYELVATPEQGDDMLRLNEQGKQGLGEAFEMLLHKKSGTPIWMEIHVNPYRNASGEIIGTLSAYSDITRRKQAEAALHKLNEELESRVLERTAQLEAQNRLLLGRDRILEATASAANALLTLENFDSAVNTALQIISESLDTDRIVVIENFDNASDSLAVWWRVLYEWNSPHAVPQIFHPDVAQGSYKEVKEWYELFCQGQSVSYVLEEAPEPFKSGQAKIGVKATHLVPIFVEAKFWGVIGFDDCREAKRRSEAELAVLKIAADCIGRAIGRDRTQKAIFKAEQERSAELAKANEALKKSLDALAADPDLNRFLGHVLKVIAQELDAPVVEHWFDTEGNTAYLNLSCCRGELLTPEQQALDPRVQGIKIPPELMHHNDLLHRQRYVIVEDLVSDPIQVSVFDPIGFDLAVWSAKYGISKYIHLPLVIGEQSIGTLYVYISCERTFTEQQIELICVLAQQVTLAMQLTQLAEEAKLAVIAREQEKVASERAVELAKANNALQAIIDTLGTLGSLDDFVPAALKIVSCTFGANSCAFYEHSIDNFIYLRYWALENHVLHPKDLLELDREKFAFVRRLAEGAEVPLAYVGDVPLRARKHTLILNHLTGTVVPEFDTFIQTHGWELELNLPLVINDVAEAALCIYRSAAKPFTTNEIALAEALGKQLALAIQLTRLAEEAKLAAKARAEEAKQAAILEERNRIAREIHDTLAQAFTGVIIQLEATKRKISNAQLETAQTHINRARSLAVEGLSEARHSVQALRPEPLEARHLTDALCHFAENMTGEATQITVGIEGSPYPLPIEIETNLLRIAQEAVTNALRHAQAQTIHIKLWFETTAVHLQITDDGQGFDPESQLMNMGFGLIGMQERSQRLGGEFTLTTNIGQGTKIIVTVLIPAVKSRTIP